MIKMSYKSSQGTNISNAQLKILHNRMATVFLFRISIEPLSRCKFYSENENLTNASLNCQVYSFCLFP